MLSSNPKTTPTRIRGSEVSLPAGVVGGSYRISAPLIHRSKLTSKANGGVGKQLSDGWSCNFAVGCSHACPFCYVDAIHKRFGRSLYGEAVNQKWGDYLLVPKNLDAAIEETPWRKWRGKEVMLSSTHDPYLPKLAASARQVLERGLAEGVHFCIQTRSFLVTKDFDLLSEYKSQIRLQVSIATANRDFARLIEPRVPPPEARIEILRRARLAGLELGVILAPIFPPTDRRPDVVDDLRMLAGWLYEVRPDHVYGESLHIRGTNLRLIETALSQPVDVPLGFDRLAEHAFHRQLREVGLQGTWWSEHRKSPKPRSF